MSSLYPDAGWYLRNCRQAFALAAADESFIFCGQTLTPDGWRREFLGALDRRINAKGELPVAGAKWRKLDPDWQRWTWRVSLDVNTPRLRVYRSTVPRDLLARLARRLSDHTED